MPSTPILPTRKTDYVASPRSIKRCILRANALTKTFLEPLRCDILKDISLTVYEGETIAIMGPSGVGKSTLLHILGTLDAPSSGSLEIAGRDALGVANTLLRNQHIGFIFQSYNLLDEYSVLDNVMMPAKIARNKNHEAQAVKLLESVGLASHKNHLAKLLSGGEKQRVAIARALCNDPDLILADEPSGNLDDTNSARIHELLISSAKELNKALIVVTHNFELAKQCDQVYTLYDGKLTLDKSV